MSVRLFARSVLTVLGFYESEGLFADLVLTVLRILPE